MSRNWGKSLKITWTDYLQHTLDAGIGNEWQVEVGEGDACTHSTGHQSIDHALLMARVIMEGFERDARG